MKNCVVRTYKRGYTKTTEYLEDKLNNWRTVKMATPFSIYGNIEYVEYILERD